MYINYNNEKNISLSKIYTQSKNNNYINKK